jgi:hypothetical protein
MKATSPWITYRTRFLVKARQLSSSLTFTDSLGRQHSGRKGDYLVESSDGVLRIAPRKIFEDIYVPLLVQSGLVQSSETPRTAEDSPTLAPLTQDLPLPPRELPVMLSLPPHLTCKSPQPYRDRSSSSPGLRSL